MTLRNLVAALALAMGGCANSAPPDTVVGDYLSGRFAARTNDVYAAADAFADAHDAAPGAPQIKRSAFFFHLAAGDYAQAMALAEKLVAQEQSVDSGFAEGALAARAVKGGDYAKARRHIANAAAEGFPRPAATLIDAWAISAIDGPEAAMGFLRSSVGDEYRGFYPLHVALLAQNAGLPDEARSAYQLSVMAFAGSAEINAYGAFLEREDNEEARDYYRLLSAQNGFGRFAGRAGLDRLDRGVESDAYARTSPAEGAAIALYSLASGVLQDTFQRRNAAEEAGFRVGEADYNLPLSLARLALYLDPDFDDARRFVGSIINSYGEHEKAIAEMAMVRPSSPYFEQAQIEIAVAQDELDRPDEAIATLRKLIKQRPDAFDARLTLAGIYQQEDRHAEAIDALTNLIERLPSEPDAIAWRYYLTRAVSYIEIDQWPAAEADLKRAVEVAPEEPTALNYLGYSWAERGENLEEAFDLIEKAVAIEAGSGAIIDSLGWAYYQRGDYDEAVGHLEQAASLEPADPTITDHLGDVYWRLGRELEARYQWRRVLELDPEAELEASVREKIESGLAAEAP